MSCALLHLNKTCDIFSLKCQRKKDVANKIQEKLGTPWMQLPLKPQRGVRDRLCRATGSTEGPRLICFSTVIYPGAKMTLRRPVPQSSTETKSKVWPPLPSDQTTTPEWMQWNNEPHSSSWTNRPSIHLSSTYLIQGHWSLWTIVCSFSTTKSVNRPKIVIKHYGVYLLS